MPTNPAYPPDTAPETITFKMPQSEMSRLRQTPQHTTVRDVSARELEGGPGSHKRDARDEPECQDDNGFSRTSEVRQRVNGLDFSVQHRVEQHAGTTNLLSVPAAEENTPSTTTAAIINNTRSDTRTTAISDDTEQLIQLRIKNAVLENELLHAEKAKQDALQGALFLAKMLSGSVGGSGVDGCLESLRRRAGRRRKERREKRGDCFGESEDGDEDSSDDGDRRGRGRSRSRRARKGILGLHACLKSKKSKVQEEERNQGPTEHDSTAKFKSANAREQFVATTQPDSGTSDYSAGIAHHDHGPETRGLGFSTQFKTTQNHKAEVHQQPPKYWQNSFNHTSFSTTVPNTPLLEHKSSNQEGREISSLQLSQSLLASQADTLHGTSFRSHEESANFGISSLEDLLDSDASAKRHSKPKAGGMSKASMALLAPVIGISDNATEVDDVFPHTTTALIDVGVEPENSGLSPEIKIAMDQLASFTGHKEPIPLKAGFELLGSFTGKALDEDLQTPTAPRSMREYNRSTPPTSFPGRNEDRRLTDTEEPRLDDDSPLRDIFGSFEEEKSAVEAQLRHGPYVNFFRYGVKYIPREGDRDYLRGVIIGNLPVDIELKDVVDRVRGGAIVGAILMDTMKLTGSKSALITFVLEESAKNYVCHTRLQPISFGNQQATTTLLQTPTWPLDNRTLNAIHRLHRTRCLSIPSFPTAILLSTLRSHLQTGPRGPSLLNLHISAHGTLHLEFSSLGAATAAFAFLTSHGAYRHLEIFFESDPCAGPVEDIALPPTAQPSFETDVELLISSDHHQIVAPVKKVDINEQILQLQRKRLAASTRQRIEIPSFSGRGIRSASWADEVIEGIAAAENGAVDDEAGDLVVQKPLTPSQRCEFKWDRFGKSSSSLSSECQSRTPVTIPRDTKEFTDMSGLKTGSVIQDTEFETAGKKEEKNKQPMNPDEILLDLSE